MTYAQRRELHAILDWTRRPVKKPFDYLVQVAVREYLNGIDAFQSAVDRGIEPFIVERITSKARVFLGNERAKRRSQTEQILRERSLYKTNDAFTHENFRVTIDNSQDRNYGMTTTSIYCVIEVWEDDQEVEKEYLINFSDYKTKEWLIRLQVWAMSNKREILMKPAGEEEMANMKMFIPKDKELT
jgi:hypothetical protein